MTDADETFEGRVHAWLHADAEYRVPEHLDTVLRRTSVAPQRPAWSSLERWLPVDTTLRPRLFNLPSPGRLVLVAAVILALVGLLIFAVGSRQQRLPPPFGLARNGMLVSSGDGDIYSIDPATGAKKVLVGGDRFDFGGTFSRDGTKFMFLRGATGCGTSDCGLILAVANADGSGVRELTPGLPALDWQDWSPDGTKIVIDSAAPDGVGHVMSVVDVTSGAMRTLDVGRPVHDLSWVPPDGTEIVFRGEQISDSEPSPGIFAIHPDGSALRPLTTRPAHSANDYQDVAVSPDGTLIAYRDDGDPDGFQQHILDLRTGVDRILPGPKGQLGAAFSPDGRFVALLRAVPVNGGFKEDRWRLVVMPVDGSSTGTELSPTAPNGQDGPTINNYSWSPDGTAILANYDDEKVSRLVPIDGSAPTTLVHGELALPGYQRLAP
jgi:Tol biopolymer transport system component